MEQMKIEEYEKQRQREEKRKEKYLKKLREQEEQQLNSKIQSEEKKLLIAQRKLESIRILEAIFERIKVCYISHRQTIYFALKSLIEYDFIFTFVEFSAEE